MLERIIRQLGDNYDKRDNQVLIDLIETTTYSALSFANKTNSDDLEDIIARCVIAQYLQRGGEGSTSLNEMGKSSAFYDPIERMQKEIILQNKRRIC